MNELDLPLAVKMVCDGQLTSPHEVPALEKRCCEEPFDCEVRWKLLGFYNAHQMCCSETKSRRIESIIWIINNASKIPRTLRLLLLLLQPSDRRFIPQVRAAWQRRIDAAPDDPDTYINMGDFLQAVMPNAACDYYERALMLDRGNELTELALSTAKYLAMNVVDEEVEDYDSEGATCLYDVLKAGDVLLQETRDRIQPSDADWIIFFDIVHPLVWSPLLITFAQSACGPSVDSPASTICKSALRQMYKTIDEKSEAGIILRKPQLKKLWKDLVKP
ncbi:MAG: hypothetical protein WCT03_06790 [Candidatus Obscuribacterales bacterium]|jgi:hypothetical protein